DVQRARGKGSALREANEGEHLVGYPARLFERQVLATEARADGGVLTDGEVVQRPHHLVRAADAAARHLVWGERGDLLAAEGDPPVARVVHAVDDVEQRCLAGAVRADEAEDLAVPQRERDVVEGDEPAEPARDGGDLEDHWT